MADFEFKEFLNAKYNVDIPRSKKRVINWHFVGFSIFERTIFMAWYNEHEYPYKIYNDNGSGLFYYQCFQDECKAEIRIRVIGNEGDNNLSPASIVRDFHTKAKLEKEKDSQTRYSLVMHNNGREHLERCEEQKKINLQRYWEIQ
jgi:hypothetical protein